MGNVSDIREHIIESSRPLFAEHGFRKLTMDQIARKMHISKRTIYEHFRSKEELIEAICDSFVANDANEMSRRLEEARTCGDKMRVLFCVYDLDGFGAAVFKRNEIDTLKRYFPKAWDRFYRLAASRKEAVGEIFRLGAEQGVFVKSYPPMPGARKSLDTDETVELITFFASAMIDEVMASDLTGYSIGLNTALQHACDMVIRAISI